MLKREYKKGGVTTWISFGFFFARGKRKENKTKSRNCAVGKTNLVVEGNSSKEKE